MAGSSEASETPKTAATFSPADLREGDLAFPPENSTRSPERFSLPSQVFRRISFRMPELEPDRLFLGDNLQAAGLLRSESIDLIYADPPFFSGRKYHSSRDGNGKKNSGRKAVFSDTWPGGLREYSEWLQPRAAEFRRLLKNTGLLYFHCDWHASHYIKALLDTVFGPENFRSEIIWYYNSGARKKKDFGRRHDVIFRYSRSKDYYADFDNIYAREPYSPDINIPACKAHYYDPRGKVADDVWRLPIIPQNDKTERLGYPTQKPEELLERIIATSCPPDGITADFFCGSGTTPAVAARLRRRWLACDISLPAVAVTSTRLTKLSAGLSKNDAGSGGESSSIPDFTIEFLNLYDSGIPENARRDKINRQLLKLFGTEPNPAAFSGKTSGKNNVIHGWKYGLPVFVFATERNGSPAAADIGRLAETMKKNSKGWNEAFVIALDYGKDALESAARLQSKGVLLRLVRVESVRMDTGEIEKNSGETAKEMLRDFIKFVAVKPV